MSLRKENSMPRRNVDLPHNSMAERAVLGSALISKDACLNMCTMLTESDFYEGKHQLIYRAITNLNAKNNPVDTLTVTEELLNMKVLDDIGGVSYLKECSDSMVALSALDFYIRIVYDQSVLRSLLLSIRDIDKKYKELQIEDVNQFILESEESIKQAISRRRVSTFISTREMAPMMEEMIKAASSNDDNVTGLTTGYGKLNELTLGFQKSEVTVLAARPSVGKTALALNLAFKAATRGAVSVAIFSLEMSKDLLFKRMIASESLVSLDKISKGQLNTNERAKINSAIKSIASTSIYIHDTPGLLLSDLINKSKKLQASDPNLGLIVIDYLGLIATPDSSKNSQSRTEEVRKISLGLKNLARELNIPVLVLSQLNRDVEKRGDNKRPQLSDLKDSGAIEQDADVVMLLYREDYYAKKPTSGSSKKVGQLSDAERFEIAREQKQKELPDASLMGGASYIEINVAKNRNGKTGRCGLFFYKDFGRFEEPPPQWEEAMREVGNTTND